LLQTCQAGQNRHEPGLFVFHCDLLRATLGYNSAMPDIFFHSHVVQVDEIDDLGHANNVFYIAWLQTAAVAHSAAQGWPGGRYHELGQGWVVRSHSIEYLLPAFGGDHIVVETWVATMKKVTSLRRYRIVRHGDGALLATAETNWAFIDLISGKPVRIPPEVAGAFAVVSRTP
jgi:acyl-CoA thioester hydrolase